MILPSSRILNILFPNKWLAPVGERAAPHVDGDSARAGFSTQFCVAHVCRDAIATICAGRKFRLLTSRPLELSAGADVATLSEGGGQGGTTTSQLEQFPIILNHADGANLAGR